MKIKLYLLAIAGMLVLTACETKPIGPGGVVVEECVRCNDPALEVNPNP